MNKAMSLYEIFSLSITNQYGSLLSDEYLPYAFATILFLLGTYFLVNEKSPNLPSINPKKPFELTNSRRLNEFLLHSYDVFLKARETFGGKPYTLFCAEGETVILPPQYLDELRNNPSLDLFQCFREDSLTYIQGLQPLAPQLCLETITNKYLSTTNLSKIIAPLIKEATLAAEEEFPQCSDWTEMLPGYQLLPLVSRISTRVFMGETMCRSKDWVFVSSDYTRMAFETMDKLRAWPSSMRTLIQWVLPSCRRLRARLEDARKIVRPLVEARHAAVAEAKATGKPVPVYNDSLEWYDKVVDPSEPYDPTVFQITLTIVAIHTTSDLLHETMVQLTQQPELCEALRNEIIQVLSTGGLKITSLHELKLMDSVLKETQRIKPVALSTFRRLVLQDIKLSDGFQIRKGQRVTITNMHMREPQYYPDPEKFDGYRFLRQRESNDNHAKNISHFVATSPEHVGFGHGRFACPGRFFASNELKIILCHLLLKYDWKMADGYKPRHFFYGYMARPDPTVKLLIKARKPEIDLNAL